MKTLKTEMELLGYDKDNQRAWRRRRDDRVAYGFLVETAIITLDAGGGWDLLDAVNQFGPFTMSRKPKQP